MSTRDSSRPPPSLAEILREWGRIGCIGFGGPPAHITLLRDLCVTRRRWLDDGEFEDAIAIFEVASGRKHVLVAQALTNLGVSYDHAGDDPAAARAHREALEIYEGLLDPHDTRVLTARMNLGATQVTVGDCEGAVTNLG